MSDTPDRVGTPRSGLAEAALIAVSYFVYTVMRVLVEGSWPRAEGNAKDVIRAEEAVGLAWERPAQDWVLERSSLVTFWNFLYQWLYFPSVVLALLIAWQLDRAKYVLLRNTLMIAAAIGILIWGLYPVSPPRFLPGYVDTLTSNGQRALAEQDQFINQYAAVPSFHVGWPAIAGVVLAMGSGRIAVWALALTPAVLLAFAVVFTGNHFVFDIIAGLMVVSTALWLARRLTGRATVRQWFRATVH